MNMNPIIYVRMWVVLCLFGASSLQAQDSTRLVLEALNQQVDYLNEMDRLLYPEYMALIESNQQMLDWVAKDKNVKPQFKSRFNPSEEYYRKAVYHKLYLPIEARDDLLRKLDSLKATIRQINLTGKELDKYLESKGYEKDGMEKGFEKLKKMQSLSRSYLVRHEDLHSVLLNVWYDFYVKKRGRNISYLVLTMNRILSQIHVVYLDLGYDPGYHDCNKHLREVNEMLNSLRERSKNDSLVLGSKDYEVFIAPLDTNYFAEYGDKSTLDFFRRYNSGIVKDINQKIIPAFNNFIKEKQLLCIKGKTEPPFYTAFTLPVTKTDLTVKIENPDIKITNPKILSPAVKRDSLSQDSAKVAEKPKEKANLLEGFATNNLIFLLDVSGSMKAGGRMDTLKSAMRYIVEEMRPEDRIGIVTYSGNAQVLLPPTPTSRKDKILPVFDRLKGEGKSNLRMGLDYAYTQMMSSKIKHGNNRIIVVTDGAIPITDDLKVLIGGYVDDDITLSVFLMGSVTDPNVNASKLTELAATGKGNFTALTRSNSRSSMLKEAQALRRAER